MHTRTAFNTRQSAVLRLPEDEKGSSSSAEARCITSPRTLLLLSRHQVTALTGHVWRLKFGKVRTVQIVGALNTTCVLDVGTAWCGGRDRARLGTDTEDSFFLEPVTPTPT